MTLKIKTFFFCLLRWDYKIWLTCPSLHWHRRVQFPAPGRHGDVVASPRREHVERALPHRGLHLSCIHGNVTWTGDTRHKSTSS